VLADPSNIWLVLRDGRPVAGSVLAGASPVATVAHEPGWLGAHAPSPCLALLSGTEA
jgi:hypothetical protein